MKKSSYSRVLLKLSGETLKGKSLENFDIGACDFVASRIREFLACGVQLAIVVGAGNIWRGGVAGADFDRVDADKMGMLATAMNAITIKNYCEKYGIKVCLQCAIPTGGFLPLYERERALQALERGEVVVFAGGTGNPFFTTDTASALRALEIRCDVVIKATKVNGIYSADPKKHPDAVRYGKLSYAEAIQQRLGVMDTSAFSLCADHRLPIVVFDFFTGNIEEVLAGNTDVGTIVC